jgi:hypothetical protein
VAAIRRCWSSDFRRRDGFQPNQIDLGRFNNKNNHFICKKGGGAVMSEENIGETHLYLMLAWLNRGFRMPGRDTAASLISLWATFHHFHTGCHEFWRGRSDMNPCVSLIIV